jgi:DNA anti-recombination protein RmuC
MNRFLSLTAFVAGLASVGWVGASYFGQNPLALAVTLAIGAFYLMGALELRRYQQATDTLASAVADLSEPPQALGGWLERLHPSLRNAVRLRVEGERVGLPGPALAPYLAGFLVLLGMLGTFVGMVVTLSGTGVALESATDLAAVRASLAAPVKGLGVAFGTSLAGIATSAMLGLLAALCRRERLRAGQLLDTRIATTLRGFSQAHQRDESFRLLQRQAEVMPALADRLQSMMDSMERQSLALHERLANGQDGLHRSTEAAWTGLASALDRSLKDSLSESARLAGAAIQPAVEATMAGVAREASALHTNVAHSVQQQLDQLAQRFAASADGVSQTWTTALAEQRRSQQALDQGLRGTLDGFAQTFEQRSATLVDQVATRLAETTGGLAERWQDALAQHARTSDALASGTQQALAATTAQFDRHAATLLQTVEQAHAALQAQLDERDTLRLAQWHESLTAQQTTQNHLAHATRDDLQRVAEEFARRCNDLVDSMRNAHSTLDTHAADRDAQRQHAWQEALTRHEQAALALGAEARAALAETSSGFAALTASLHRGLEQAHADLQAQAGTRNAEQLAAWDARLHAVTAELRTQWEQASAHALGQQQRICTTLAETADTMARQAEQQAGATVAEIGHLVEAAAQAPRAAAEVIAELRDKLTDSMARDHAMLDERTRMLETLNTLLDAVNHASTEQRAAIDALVGASAQVLERVGTQFTQQVESGTGQLAEVAAQLGTGAAEVASLGESFGFAVQLFSQSNEKLGTQLQRIETALGQSMQRSDEQLAYYVAQAREVIDLSIMSQKQIVDDLQQIARNQAAVASEA